MSTTARKMKTVEESQEKKSLIREMAAKYHIDAEKFLTTLRDTAFRQKPGQEISNEQMQVLLMVANEYNLNPFLKQIYAFPDRNNGIIPVVGVDGYIRIVNEHPQADGWSFNTSENMIDVDQYATSVPEWVECIMYRKDRNHPIVARVYMVESYREPFKTNSGHLMKGPWQSHPRLMLNNRAFTRAARFAFGFTGIYTEDDAERMQEREYIDAEVISSSPGEPAPVVDDVQPEIDNDFLREMDETVSEMENETHNTTE